MSARVREHATYEDLLRVPEVFVAELIDGDLFATRLIGPQINALSSLGAIIGSIFDLAQDSWRILKKPGVYLGSNVVVPDIAGWRRATMPEIPREHFTIRPDWVCEILGPGSEEFDRSTKLPFYAREGVQHAWIVDVAGQYLEVRRLEGDAWQDDGVFTGKVRAEPFDAIEIDMTLVWGPPPA
jgi:Uma2 family endonuclease